MLGSIIGDIAGSTYEVDEIIAKKAKTKISYEQRIKILDEKVPLYNDNSSYTDDSVLTVAIADALLNNKDYGHYLKTYGFKELNLGKDKYGRSRFGSGFTKWLLDGGEGCSFGNGSAMRVSPIGYYFNTLEEVIEQARLSAIPSHNNEEAIAGAVCIASTIFLVRKKYSKKEIQNYIEQNFNYDLKFDIMELQKNNIFSSKCCVTVPQAIYCFLASNSFEDAIRKAISIGGDTDTIACMTGSIAEAYYGIPIELLSRTYEYLPSYIIAVINEFNDHITTNYIKRKDK